MENNEIKMIKSERGEDLILLDNNKFRLIRKRKDTRMKWKCSNNICTASILTDSEKRTIIERLGKHNHSNIPTSTLERQVVRENCKRKAVDSISTKPNKIIRTELLTDNYSNLCHKDFTTVRKCMYTERRKYYPQFPKSLDEVYTQLNKNQNETSLMYKGEKFIHVPDNQLFICLTTAQNIEFMTTCTDFFGDGTFEYAPKYFVQLYTIHCFKNGHYVPVVYFFLNNKLKETYTNMWKFIVDLCFKLTKKVLTIPNLHLDFERGAHKAVKEVFPDINIVGCRFHLGQAWWRKVT